MVWKVQSWYSYLWSFTKVSTGNYICRTNSAKKQLTIFRLTWTGCNFFDVFRSICSWFSFHLFYKKKTTHTKIKLWNRLVNNKNSTLSKVSSREVILIISKIKNVSCSTHDKIWPNASIVRWEDFTHVQTNWKWETKLLVRLPKHH